ncbi:NAD(P)-binding Rossmann-like domain-containing protein [Desulfocicer vacuolatum DSM 3385]|uniref:NAD(P)-binding Rossmann-like domain-containing protein n=1 Tax=Desulfocicer vacuolatum DSM 3385 TaxID=1121400 RepID=A0A1W2AQW7_9BACT|nr:FAD-dependent oxidoreductase [Desulfocicer vacuolatum]SMC63063.1 NAD(P)-binding Rossmann-like domain-containing protein [Desulfocicer vacuolatum DSM 3385]
MKNKPKKKHICIVGAGISGITAAHTLKEKGHRVTVFERGRSITFAKGRPLSSPRFDRGIGGKCHSPKINGKAYEMGACSCAPGFSTVLEMARKYKAPLRKRMPFRVVAPGGREQTFRSVYWPFRATLTILREMAVYLCHVLSFARRCDDKTGYRNIPAKWRVSFADFCRTHNLVYIPRWLELPVVSFGYGTLDEIETWFVFNYITAVNFLGIAFFLILAGRPPVRRLDMGYEDLVTRMAANLDVRTRHEVVAIDRSNGVRVTVCKEGHPEFLQYDFDALVLSVPLPLLKGVVDFSEKEAFLTRHIHLSPYTIVACEIKDVDNVCLLVRHRVHSPGHVALIEETVEGTRGFCVCYIPEKKWDRSHEEIIMGLEKDLKEINAALVKVHAIKKWHYFPRFKDADLYRTLQGLQGENSTFYVGAIAKFELAERVAAHARGLMDGAFDGVRKKERLTLLKNFGYYYFKSCFPKI